MLGQVRCPHAGTTLCSCNGKAPAGHQRRRLSLRWVFWKIGVRFGWGESQPKVGLNGAKPREPGVPAFGHCRQLSEQYNVASGLSFEFRCVVTSSLDERFILPKSKWIRMRRWLEFTLNEKRSRT